jgi:DNA processing protein
MLSPSSIYCVRRSDANYPELLKEIPKNPEQLYVLGNLPPDNLPLVAVVGTRKHTREGKLITEQFTTGLASHGLGIVSGLALGVDGLAHAAALSAGAYTIAVLGSGLAPESLHPQRHRLLAEQIVQNGGALVSEYPPEFKATLYSFPQRNRIIAGLSIGTLVTEAPVQSGALITAKAALDYNREVMAVPHSIYNQMGAGNNEIIKRGAQPVMSWRDCLEALDIEASLETPKAAQPTLTGAEAAVFKTLTSAPVHIDMLIKAAQLPGSAVTSAVTLLELKGLVKNIGGAQYIKTS